MLPVACDGLTKTWPSTAFNPHAFARDIAMAECRAPKRVAVGKTMLSKLGVL
jgi:hypothetical protein